MPNFKKWLKILTYLKRLGAYYYKTNRSFYELHKCCCFKFGCTLIIVMIQIMCNKNYKCQNKTDQKTNNKTNSSSDEQSDNEINKTKAKNKKKKKQNQTKINMDKSG